MRAGARLRRHQPYFKKIAQHVRDVIQLLRRAQAGQIKSAQRHAIKLAVVLRRFRGQQNLLAVQRRPEGVGHLASHGHGGVKIRAANIETNLARDHGFVKARSHAERRSDLGKQSAAIAAIVKISQGRTRHDAKLVRVLHYLGWRGSFRSPFPQRVGQSLLGKFILRIQMQRGAELGQRFDLAALAHLRIAPLQVIEHQLLAGHFPRRHVLHIFGSQPRRRLKLVECLVLPLFPLQLQSLGKRFTGFFYFLLGWIAGDSPGRTFRTRQERRNGWRVAGESRGGPSQCQQDERQPNEVSPAHVPIVTGEPGRDRRFRHGQCTFVYSSWI